MTREPDRRTDRDILIGIEHKLEHLDEKVDGVTTDQEAMWKRHQEHGDVSAELKTEVAVLRERQSHAARALWGLYAAVGALIVAVVGKYILFFGG